MPKPKVSFKFGNNNLGILAAATSGTMGLVAAIPVANTSGFGVPVLIKTKAQAKAELGNAQNATILAAITEAFFGETSEGSPLYCVFISNASTLTNGADINNSYVSDMQTLANKNVRAMGFVRQPVSDYVPVVVYGFDKDVHSAVIKAQAQADFWKTKNKVLECIVEGRSATIPAEGLDYSTKNYPNVHIVIGSENGSSAYSVLRALGKKAANAIHRNIGRVRSGSLNIAADAAVSLGVTTTSVATPETKASATITITGLGTDSNNIQGWGQDAFGYLTEIFDYSKVSGDDTAPKIATAINALINTSTATTGYSSTVAGAVVTVHPPAGMGSTLNGINVFVVRDPAGPTFTQTAFSGGVDAINNVVAATPESFSDTDLDTWNDKRYIFYTVNEDPTSPGYIFSDDISLVNETSDYGTWSNNAVIGEAARISYATCYKLLKDDVDVDDNGRMGAAVETNIQQLIEDDITKQIGGSISAVSALFNPDTAEFAALYANANISTPNLNLLQTGGNVYVFVTVRPKGYAKNILVVLGFGL